MNDNEMMGTGFMRPVLELRYQTLGNNLKQWLCLEEWHFKVY